MNIQPIAGVGDRINEIRLFTAKIVNEEILPHENELWVTRSDDAPESTKKLARELRGHQGQGEAGRALDAAPSGGVRRLRASLPRARLQERGAGLLLGRYHAGESWDFGN